jgi:ribosome biogenesis protein MAK21
MLRHFHPSVSLHARQLLSSQPLTATPDLSLNTISHFLDRFVYKNPKKPKLKGDSAMQPGLASNLLGASGVHLRKGEVRDEIGLMNDDHLISRRLGAVPEDQVWIKHLFIG